MRTGWGSADIERMKTDKAPMPRERNERERVSERRALRRNRVEEAGPAKNRVLWVINDTCEVNSMRDDRREKARIGQAGGQREKGGGEDGEKRSRQWVFLRTMEALPQMKLLSVSSRGGATDGQTPLPATNALERMQDWW